MTARRGGKVVLGRERSVSSLEHWESVGEESWSNGPGQWERAGDGTVQLGQDRLLRGSGNQQAKSDGKEAKDGSGHQETLPPRV